jgi:hypothetical protein
MIQRLKRYLKELISDLIAFFKGSEEIDDLFVYSQEDEYDDWYDSVTKDYVDNQQEPDDTRVFTKYDGLYYSHLSGRFVEVEDHQNGMVLIKYEYPLLGGLNNIENVTKSLVDQHLKKNTWEKVIDL